MTRYFIRRLTSPFWQVGISGAFTALMAVILFYTPARSGVSGVDRATFVSALGSVATLLALFCSLSLSWILFLYQQIKSHRIAAYDMLKQCVIDMASWLQTSEQACYRELCLSLLWEIDKIKLTDIPFFDSFPEYEEYCTALAFAMDSEDMLARQFFQRSSFYLARIEELVSRFGITALQLTRLKWFIDALAKGFLIVSASVFVLLCTLIWFTEYAKPLYIMAVTFLSGGTVLVLLEVWVDLMREYEEELTFVQRKNKG